MKTDASKRGLNLDSHKIDYNDDLNDKQKENFNFQKVSSVLADRGFMTLRVSSDWQSADFIAQHIDGITFLKVQLKGRFTIDGKYVGKDLYICFPDRPWNSACDLDGDKRNWYLCPHDLLMDEALRVTKIGNRPGWLPKRSRTRRSLPRS